MKTLTAGHTTVCFAALLACIGLVGCFPVQPKLTPAQQLEKAVKIDVKDDPYQPYIEYQSGLSSDNRTIGLANYDNMSWLVIGRKSRKTSDTFFFVQWRNSYVATDWRFYERASDSAANELEMQQVSRDVGTCFSDGSCSHVELYSFVFTQPQMVAGRASGLSFKIYAHDGSAKVVSVNPRIVDNLLRTMGY
jgi:hypothetical protein